MRFSIENPKESLITTFRRCGYVFQRYEGEEVSFVRVFGHSGYPRFHIYARERKGGIDINIHFDTKKSTYGEGSRRHHAEYENDGVLKEEIERVIRYVNGLIE